MKIIKSAKYKNIESGFEGEVYTPEVEERWVNTVNEKLAPFPGKKVRYKNRNQARFRPSGIDRVPVSVLPYAKQHEQDREEAFSETIKNEEFETSRQREEEERSQKEQDMKLSIYSWVGKIWGSKVRNKIKDYYGIMEKENNFEEIDRIYRASQGDKKSLRELSKILGKTISTDIRGPSNSNFYYAPINKN